MCHPQSVITRKNALWWAVAAVVAAFVLPPAATIIAVIVLILGYLLSIQFHPHTACRRCGGSGRHAGSVWAYGNRPCGACGGQARHRRWGAQFFHRDKQVRAEARASVATKRRSRPL